MTAVVVDGQTGKEYRSPTPDEAAAACIDGAILGEVFGQVPNGLPNERMPSQDALGMRTPRYGFDSWQQLFSNRQLLALGTFVHEIRGVFEQMVDYPPEWREAVVASLGPSVSRLADRCSTLATWTNDFEKIRSTFARFALPMVWDFAESCPLTDTTGGFIQAVEWIARVCEHLHDATDNSPACDVVRRSATAPPHGEFDVICTDPPYYDAIPYSDLMDFFYGWLRRVLGGVSLETDSAFSDALGPKWDGDINDGELIDDASRFGGDKRLSKRNYEDGMARAFANLNGALRDDGRFIIVFANKQPDAWETLLSLALGRSRQRCGTASAHCRRRRCRRRSGLCAESARSGCGQGGTHECLRKCAPT